MSATSSTDSGEAVGLGSANPRPQQEADHVASHSSAPSSLRTRVVPSGSSVVEFSQKRRVVISGGAGFLGSHLVDRFLDVGDIPVAIDNLLTGSLSNVAAARGHPDFQLIQHDILEPITLEADLILNLACPASPRRYQADPIHTFKTSIHGALNMAENALSRGVRLVHTSTSEVYGDPEIHPQPEHYRGAVSVVGPRACYDEGKRAAETVLFDLNRTRGLDIGICRIFNTYGPRMDPYDGRVVSNLIRQALLGETMTLYGTGSQTRSFCYVDDLVEGIWRLAHAGPDVVGPINLGNPFEISVLELAEVVCELCGHVADFEFLPLPTDDPSRRRPDISRAKVELDWEPTVSLRDGLMRTIDYFDNLITSGGIDGYAERDRVNFSPAGT